VKTHLVFVTIALHQMAGGLERNFLRVVNYFANRGYDVSVITFDLPGAIPFYPLSPKVRWHPIGTSRPHAPITFIDRWRLIGHIRKILQNIAADRIVGIVFHHGILIRFFLAAWGLGIRVVAAERNALSLYQHIRRQKWNINFIALALVHKIIVLFPSYRSDYPFYVRAKIEAIPNAVDPVEHLAAPERPNQKGRFNLISVGRLCDQKNFNVLIRSFASLSPAHPEWDLKIYGGGDHRQELNDLIDSLGLSARTFLLPETKDISRVYHQAHLYVVTSRWEGFPNAVAEAMAHGLPVVGYRGCAGVADLVQDQRTGLLADGNGDQDSLSIALAALMSNSDQRRLMGQQARESVVEFAPMTVYGLWEKLVTDVGND
jgi:glycosyltransferase involved in cell wall biosynthesis